MRLLDSTRVSAALVLLGGCKAAPIIVDTSDPDDSTVTLALRNPTTSDPLRNVTTFRLEMLAHEEVVVSHDFEDLSVPPEMGDISEYGVVRFQIAGIGGGEVLSYGRSAEVVLEPGENLLVPITFLPVNEVLPLEAGMTRARSGHAALGLLDGRVLLAGGHNPGRTSSHTDMEVFDPFNESFQPLGSFLPEGVGDARVLRLDNGEALFFAGRIATGRGYLGENSVGLFDPSTETYTEVTTLSMARDNPCVGQYLPRAFLVLGGSGTSAYADIVRRADSGDTWSDMQVTLRGGLRSEDVTGCLADADNRVFIQGVDAESTGIWDPAEGISNPGEAFTAITPSTAGDARYVRNALVHRKSPGVIWIAGGVDTSSSQVVSGARDFRMASMSFVNSLALKRGRNRPSWDTWIDGDWLVVGCGFSDAAESQGETLIEFVDPVAGERGPEAYLDRDRAGCQVNTLLDGSVLVTGGFSGSTSTSAATAAIMVPYFGS
jgi:hypothetical protein